MELGRAAQLLGVDHHTAYRRVRVGDLVAARIGCQYEVPTAAVNWFLARRGSSLSSLVGDGLRAGPVPPLRSQAEVLARLAALNAAAAPSTREALDTIAYWLGESIGDGCVIWLLSEEGRWLVPVSMHHRNPVLCNWWSGLLSTVLFNSFGSPEGNVAATADPVREDSFPIEALRWIPPNTLRLDDGLPEYCAFVCVPITVAHGRVVGVITLFRATDDEPFPDTTERTAALFATWAAASLLRARRVRPATVAEPSLARTVERLVERVGAPLGGWLVDVLHDLLDPEGHEAVFAADRTLLAATKPFLVAHGAMRYPGRPLTVDGPNPIGAVDWPAVVASNLGHRPRRCSAATVPNLRWSVIRGADGAPAAIVASDGPAVERPDADASAPTSGGRR